MKIGLTGGIGSGKTTVARVFEQLGIPVYYADERARFLMNNSTEIRAAIQQHFGNATYNEQGLDRKYLASIVFNDPHQIDLLNSLTHPVTIRDASEWMQQQTTPYVIKEAALLFESGSVEQLDAVIGVEAPKALRMQRAMHRDQVSADEIRKRMARQIDETIKMRLCDYIIINNEQQLVIPQVIALHEKLLLLAKTGNY